VILGGELLQRRVLMTIYTITRDRDTTPNFNRTCSLGTRRDTVEYVIGEQDHALFARLIVIPS
jgi:hypothetical protein